MRVATGRRPVALAVGQLDSPRSWPAANGSATASSPRKAVVVVLTAGWSLLCFDHNLQLLWENAMGDSLPQSWAPREVALLVSPHPLHPGDRGLVIVAASASRPEASIGAEGWADPLAEEVAWEARLARGRHPGAAADGGASAGVDVRHHVNYYAFEGRMGAVRWRHESPDFHPPGDALADSLVPQHNYRLDAASLEGRHAGEAACREYREAVAASLPHSWARPADTRLRLAHWAKHRVAGQGASLSGSPGSVAAPNVVVAHLQDGLEAVHLASGHTVCKLSLSRGELHADLNADGVVDHVAAAGWRAGTAGRHRAHHCLATVTSGSPARPLFNGSVCRALHLLSGAHARQQWQSAGDPPGGVPIELAPAAAVASYGARAGGRSARRRWDVVFLNSRGDVTSFSHEGRRHFQLRTDADWGPEGGVATLHALLLRAGSTVPALLVAGERMALLLSPAGSQLARLALPSKPVAPLQVVDLAGDGTASLLLHTEVGLFAYRQLQRPGTLPLAFLLGGLLLVGLALSMAAQPAEQASRSTDWVDDLRPRDD